MPIDLIDPSFAAKVRQYSHKSIVIDVYTIQDHRMINLARFLDEFFDSNHFLLIFSVLHQYIDQKVLRMTVVI